MNVIKRYKQVLNDQFYLWYTNNGNTDDKIARKDDHVQESTHFDVDWHYIATEMTFSCRKYILQPS